MNNLKCLVFIGVSLFSCFCSSQEKQTGDWRKNIEDKAAMDGRKKMFETDA